MVARYRYDYYCDYIHVYNYNDYYWWLRELVEAEAAQQFVHGSCTATASKYHHILVTTVQCLLDQLPACGTL